MERIDMFTAAALGGLASRDYERHGHTPPTAEELGRRAVELAQGAVLALEDIETEPAPTKRPVFATPPQAALPEERHPTVNTLLHDEPKHTKTKGR